MAREVSYDAPQPEKQPNEELVRPVLKPFQVSRVGTLDQETVEALLLGWLLDSPHAPECFKSTKAADLMIQTGIRKEWFENKAWGEIYETLMAYYKENRHRCTPETFREMEAMRLTQDEALMYEAFLVQCLSAAIFRHGIDPAVLVSRMKDKFFYREANKHFKSYIEDVNNPKVGPSAALEKFRSACMTDLSDPSGGALVAGDLGSDYEQNMFEIMDMKENPEKYAGHLCGIQFIDDVTKGFVPGQLTVLVGANGGYKSSTMMNIALGCWRRGLNVLYVTLEMDRKLIERRIMAMGTKRVSARRLREGVLTSPDDWDRLQALKVKMESSSPEERKILEKKVERLSQIISYATAKDANGKPIPELTDEYLLRKFREEVDCKPNKLMVASGGLHSAKIKTSHMDTWLKEHRAVFKPDVVLVDYLGLVEGEISKGEVNRAQELGDICKMLRKMGATYGFHVITAAQYSRKAFERIRKAGFTTPEKADLGTDDIADSSMIGNDADFIVMLWPDPEGLIMMNPKNRHGEKIKTSKVPVDADTNLIGSKDVGVDSASEITNNVKLADAYTSINKLTASPPMPDEFSTEDELIGIAYEGPAAGDGGESLEGESDDAPNDVPGDDTGDL